MTRFVELPLIVDSTRGQNRAVDVYVNPDHVTQVQPSSLKTFSAGAAADVSYVMLSDGTQLSVGLSAEDAVSKLGDV